MGTIVIKDHIDENKKKKCRILKENACLMPISISGIIKWKIEPVKYQRELRDEWAILIDTIVNVMNKLIWLYV